MKQRSSAHSLRRTDSDLASRWREIDEAMKVSRAAMRCHAAGGQTNRRQLDDIPRRRAADEIDVSRDVDDAASLEQAGDLTPRKTDFN